MTLDQFFRGVVLKFAADLEMVRAQLAVTPKCPFIWQLFRTMPLYAPCQEYVLRAKHAAVSSRR